MQIGTFLEYFDLMLYVHMAVLLNEIFFEKTDPHTAALMSAFAFCSTYVLRPFGALIFGRIGDTIGRKATVIITTILMSVSCIIMANLPTYAQIGASAAWIVTLCRIAQGLSSMGEVIGAKIYVTEMTKPPVQYPAVAFLSVASAIGGMAALSVASLVTTRGFDWRVAFWLGAGIAVVGSVARTRLRETPEFLNGNKLRQRGIEVEHTEGAAQAFKLQRLQKGMKRQKINKKTFAACSFIECGYPVCFYLVFVYMNPTLKALYGYSSEDIIFHNFLLSIIQCSTLIFCAVMSYKIYPLKILTLKGTVFMLFALALPALISISPHSHFIFMLQAIILLSSLDGPPADSIFISHFSVLRRFTSISFIYALTRALMYVITSFGLVYLTEWFGHYGLWFIILPVATGYLWGVNHFKKLEQKLGRFPKQASPQASLAIA